jgi:hypothetical protein
MLFSANLLSWFLAIGWWFSSTDRWEPAIVFVGLTVALAQQVRLRFAAGDRALTGGQKGFVVAIILAALAITRPSKEAHLGALMKSESDRAAARFVERMAKNGDKHKDFTKSVGNVFGASLGPVTALRSRYFNLFFFSVAEGHSLSFGMMGYVAVLNEYPHLLPSFTGERYLAQYMSRLDEWRKKRKEQLSAPDAPASAASQ